MPFNQPLDLQYWLVNVFSGTTTIFMFISVIVIAALAARFKMPNVVALAMFALFTVFMVATPIGAEFSGVYLLVVLIAGLATYYSIAKLVKN